MSVKVSECRELDLPGYAALGLLWTLGSRDLQAIRRLHPSFPDLRRYCIACHPPHSVSCRLEPEQACPHLPHPPHCRRDGYHVGLELHSDRS